MTAGTLIADAAAPPTTVQVHLCYITDRCVAARVDAREQPEWPPHPGRLYMALAAAYFETDGSADEKAAEQAALEWLASRPAPRLHALSAHERTPVVYYVPVNDALQPNKAMLQSAPGMPRSRQSRSFPTAIPQRHASAERCAADVVFEWPDDADAVNHLAALDRLCRNVIRVGHSSSLVMAWAETGALLDHGEVWEPASTSAEITCRIAANGELQRLKALCQADRIEQFAALKEEIDSSTGKIQKAAKERFAELFGEPYKMSLRPPEPIPATLGIWQGYRRPTSVPEATERVIENRYFDSNLVILGKIDGPVLNVERTLGLTAALRGALLKANAAGGGRPESIPAWLSGHDADGTPTSKPHAALLALPFAKHKHADGHIMGLAIALPKGVALAERARGLRRLLIDEETGDFTDVRLWGAGLPDWTLRLETGPSPAQTLQNSTWTKPSTTWRSVTPIVLDRFPKTSRSDDRTAWQAEVIEIVKQACLHGGLPEPDEVGIDSTSFVLGIPRAWAKTRRLQGKFNTATAPLGDGFPPLEPKSSRSAKPQVHVRLRFSTKVSGPVLIGAGRFAGYGLCLPCFDD